jgi:hypothetical protein
MDAPRDILSQLVLAGGPPRSGTTLLAKVLNHHPGIVTRIDDRVWETWHLYHYPSRTGLVQRLQAGPIQPEAERRAMRETLVRDGSLQAAAPSAKTRIWPLLTAPVPPAGSVQGRDPVLVRHSGPSGEHALDYLLCLKSPEISFVLPELGHLFPDARFLLVFRPILEIAESMYRKAQTVKRVAVYSTRWRQEMDDSGRLLPPPGVPLEWQPAWNQVTDFQRCAIYAASYIRALATTLPELEPGRWFLYHHHRLLVEPDRVFQAIGAHLKVDPSGFQTAREAIHPDQPRVPDPLCREFEIVADTLDLLSWQMALQTLCGSGLGVRHLQAETGL